MYTLTDSKAVNLLKKMIDDVDRNGIIVNTAIEDLKALRPYTITEQLPLLAKATRLAAEHLESNETFTIGIPDEDPIEEGAEIPSLEANANESFHYFLCLIRDVNKKANEADLRTYVNALNNA